jgi:hypothetical protein
MGVPREQSSFAVRDKDFSCSPKFPVRHSEARSRACSVGIGANFLGIKRRGNHSPPSGAEIKIAYRETCPSLLIFIHGVVLT